MEAELWKPQNKRSRIPTMPSSHSQSIVSKSWADLPSEILLLIGQRLATPLEVSSFISVCMKWRSSLSVPTTSKPNPNPRSILSPFLPLQIPNSATLPFTNRPHDPLILVARAVFRVHPIDSDPNSKGWLLTVEERNPGKLRLLRVPDSIQSASNFPKFLSLFKYRVTEVAKDYKLRFATDDKDVCAVEKWRYRARKVVLCSTSSITECTAMVLYGDGILVGVRVRTGQWGFVHRSLVSPFEGLGNYEGMVCALDDRGHAYSVDHMLMQVNSIIASGDNQDFRRMFRGNGNSNDKPFKSLNHHVMESGGKLYLVVWDYSDSSKGFNVFEQNKAQREWVRVETFERSVLFVTQQWCFLVGMNYGAKFKGKAFVYCSGCFYNSGDVRGSHSLFQGYTVNLGFYSLLEEQSDRDRQSTSYYRDGEFKFFERDMADMLWLAPQWFWPVSFSSVRNEEDRDSQSNVVLCASECEYSENDSFSKLKAELNISCDLVPTLQKVWAKHGNILEGSNVHSKLMMSSSLESLAKLIIVLEGNSGTTLTDAQCNDMTCTLRDLQHLSLRVDWLVPFVEKAVTLYISKPMIAAVAKLDNAIARAHLVKLTFPNGLAGTNEVLRALEQDRVKLERMPSLKHVDLDERLGKGLFLDS